jgi:hypothetical protein
VIAVEEGASAARSSDASEHPAAISMKIIHSIWALCYTLVDEPSLQRSLS